MPDVTVSVSVSGVPPTLIVGQTVQAVARITTDVPDSSLDTKPVVWSSTSPAVATVDTNGLVKAVAAGTTQIKATVGTVSGVATTAVALPVVKIDLAAETALAKAPLGSQVILEGPTPIRFTLRVDVA